MTLVTPKETPKKIISGYNFTRENIILGLLEAETIYYDISKTKEYLELIQNRNALEKIYIQEITRHFKDISDICGPISKIPINPEKIRRLIINSRSRFFDPKIMKLLFCVANISTTLYNPYPKNKSNLNITLFWNQLFEKASGSFGQTFKSTTIGLEEGFIIKHSKKSDISLTHEIFIGLILNTFRPIIPNFMYVYGYFTCSEPIKTYKKSVFSICDFEGNDDFAIFENILGETFTNHLLEPDLKIEDFLNPFLQVLLALNSVSKLRFSHNDLHCGNIILRPLHKEVFIPYTFKDRKIYLKTESVATLIDFGSAFAFFYFSPHGEAGKENQGIFPDKPNYIRDAYKLFMFSMFSLSKSKNEKLIYVFEPIFRFFNKKENLLELLVADRRNLYNISEVKGYSHAQLIDYILLIFEPKFITNEAPKEKVLICEQTTKGNEGVACVEDALKYFDELLGTTKSVINFFQRIRRVPAEKQKLNIYINNEMIFIQTFKFYEAIINQTLDKLKNLEKLAESVLSNKEYFKYYSNFSLLHQQVYNITEIFGDFTKIYLFRDSLIYYYAYNFSKEIKNKYSEKMSETEQKVDKINKDYKPVKKMIISLFEKNLLNLYLYNRGRTSENIDIPEKYRSKIEIQAVEVITELKNFKEYDSHKKYNYGLIPIVVELDFKELDEAKLKNIIAGKIEESYLVPKK